MADDDYEKLYYAPKCDHILFSGNVCLLIRKRHNLVPGGVFDSNHDMMIEMIIIIMLVGMIMMMKERNGLVGRLA